MGGGGERALSISMRTLGREGGRRGRGASMYGGGGEEGYHQGKGQLISSGGELCTSA